MGTDTGQNRHWIGYFCHIDSGELRRHRHDTGGGDRCGDARFRRDRGAQTGMVAPGRQADFIVLDANPLESISNTRRINKVYLRGQEVPRAAMAAKWQSEFPHRSDALDRSGPKP